MFAAVWRIIYIISYKASHCEKFKLSKRTCSTHTRTHMCMYLQLSKATATDADTHTLLCSLIWPWTCIAHCFFWSIAFFHESDAKQRFYYDIDGSVIAIAIDMGIGIGIDNAHLALKLESKSSDSINDPAMFHSRIVRVRSDVSAPGAVPPRRRLK